MSQHFAAQGRKGGKYSSEGCSYTSIKFICVKEINIVLNALSMTEKYNKVLTLREQQPCGRTSKECQGTGYFCILSKELYNIFKFSFPVHFGNCSPPCITHSPHGFEFQRRAWRFYTGWSWYLGRKIKPSISFCQQSD